MERLCIWGLSIICGGLLSACEGDSQAKAESGQNLQRLEAKAHVQNPARPDSLSDERQLPPPPSTDTAINGDLLRQLPQGIAIPQGMVFVPGGMLELGAADGLPREQPVSQQPVRGFFMDIHPVTVGQWRSFVGATGYQSDAEKFGNSIIHDMRGQLGWHLVDGANWAYPRGPQAGPAPDDHPVTQVSFRDALAYCEWADKRLPTEAEWEHAARNGNNSRHAYSWGDEINPKGIYKANFWQGSFPFVHEVKDGYPYTNPVGAFGKTPLGLSDMAGNVWEWCQDWYRYYGPEGAFIETTPGQRERVMRGGSFMCDPDFCHGYRVSGRSGTTPESALFHLGFRGVRSVEGGQK